MAVVDLVQIGRQDALLALVAGEGPGEVARLEDLLDLADPGIALQDVLGEQPRPHELLGHRRCAAIAGPGQVLQHGHGDRVRVVALVLPERAVLYRGGRVKQDLGNVLVRDDTPSLHLEAGQLDGAGAVVYDGGLRVVELLEARHIRQFRFHPVKEGETRCDARDGSQHSREQEAEQDQERGGDPSADAGALGWAGADARQREPSNVGVALPVTVAVPGARGLSSIHAN